MLVSKVAKPTLYGFQALDERRVLIESLARMGLQLGANDVRQLRRALFEDEAVSRDEAMALFALERAQKGRTCTEWTEFFVECVTEHLVWQSRPTGVVNNEQAEWLIRECDATCSANAYALLAYVLASAHRAPQWLPPAARNRLEAPQAQIALAEAAQIEATA